MINFFRYEIFDTFWSLNYVTGVGLSQHITLLRIGWFECIGAVIVVFPSVATAVHGFLRQYQ